MGPSRRPRAKLKAKASSLRVALPGRSYEIVIADGGFQPLNRWLRRQAPGARLAVITNRTVRRWYGAALARAVRGAASSLTFLEIPDTERAKSAAVALQLARRLARAHRRHVPVIAALGGGVVGDVAGFVAGIYRRGVPYVQLPTTLLAQVDSAIGGKTGVDVPEAKNLIGVIYQPRLVVANLSCLHSLDGRQLRTGLAEIIKCGVIADAALFRYVERRLPALMRRELDALRWVVYRAARVKARVVSRDERETRGVRTLLNFGHTVGHAIEAAAGYGSHYTHGEAIAVGMLVATDISRRLGLCAPQVLERQERLFRAAGLPTCARGVTLRRILEAQSYDKKFLRGTNRWVLPTAVGRAVVRDDVPARLIRAAMAARLEA